MAQVVIIGGGIDPLGCAVGRCYALEVGGVVYLLDCGESCGARLRPNGIDWLAVRAVFITHMHYDHMAGLFGFLFGLWAYCRREEDVPAAIREFSSYGRIPEEALPASLTLAIPAEGLRSVRGFLPAVYLAPELWRFPLHFLDVHEGVFYEDERVQTSAFPTGHLRSQPLNHILPALYPSVRLESFGFRIQLAEGVIVYSGDLALAGEAGVEELRPHVQDASVIVCEVAHVPPEALLPMVCATDADRIVLVHVHEKLMGRLHAYLDAHPDRRVVLARNGMRVSVDGTIE